MSMRSSFIHGYGFELYCNDNEGKIIDFIKTHKDTFCKSDREKEIYSNILEYIEWQDNLEDFFEDYTCEISGMEGFGAAISNIMCRETGIRFEYQKGDECCSSFPSVVFSTGYPWGYNRVEKSLTEKDIFNICKKYMKELNINTEPAYLSIEYYG